MSPGSWLIKCHALTLTYTHNSEVCMSTPLACQNPDPFLLAGRRLAAAGNGGPGEQRAVVLGLQPIAGGYTCVRSPSRAFSGPVLQPPRHRLQSSRIWLDRCVWLVFKAGK